MAHNAVDDASGALRPCRYVLHDRDISSVPPLTRCWHPRVYTV
jgi:hypothetical protein